jgi:ketosteroid isomerase-like protein
VRIFLLLILLLAACAHARAPGAAEDEASIRARLAQWTGQYNSGDYAGAADIWAPGLIGVAGGGAPDDSFEREQAGARRGSRPPDEKYALQIDEVVVAGDLAVVRDTWRSTGPGGTTTFRSFEVWQRQADGQWKITRWIDAPKEP